MPSEYYREVFGGEVSQTREFASLEEANGISNGTTAAGWQKVESEPSLKAAGAGIRSPRRPKPPRTDPDLDNRPVFVSPSLSRNVPTTLA